MAAACQELQLDGQVAVVHPPVQNGATGSPHNPRDLNLDSKMCRYGGQGLEVVHVCDVAGRWWDVCGMTEDGAILVRPDGHVGWISEERGGDDRSAMIGKALRAIHGRE